MAEVKINKVDPFSPYEAPANGSLLKSLLENTATE
jgi:hypothetical protein